MPFEVSPHKLVYGGEALGHAEGHTVLVSRALPGERLEVEPVRTAKGVVHARPLRVLEAAPERIAPPCPYFGQCGGCQYQHLEISGQLAWKAEILRDTLRRIGKITWDQQIVAHHANPWNYRNQAQLKISQDAAGRTALGFFEAESHRLVSVDQCLILSPLLNSILHRLRDRAWLDRLQGVREIELLADDRDERARIVLQSESANAETAALAKDLFEQVGGISGVALSDRRHLQVFGDATVAYRVGEFGYQISPGSFFQSSRYLLPEFVDAVVGGERGELALDLYAGVGLFTLPLSRNFKEVIGVESHPAAACDLEANALMHGAGNIHAVGATAFDFLRRFAQREPDLAILDPPRAGVGKTTLQRLARLRARRLHYAACHPPTWARDLAYLLGRGYRLEKVEMFDFFPQTYHIECLACLVREN